MQMFILSVISALKELLKSPSRLLWRVFSIFFDRQKPSPQIPPLVLRSPSDSPYEAPSERIWDTRYQTSVISQHSTVNEIPLRDILPLKKHTPSTHRDASVVEHIECAQPPRPAATSSVALPEVVVLPEVVAAPKVVVAPKVVAAPNVVAAPKVVVAPEVIAAPEVFAAPKGVVAPEVDVALEVVVVPKTAVPTEAIDSLSYETPQSLRHKARSEGNLKAKYFSQSKVAFADDKKRLAKELSLRGEMHNENMLRFDEQASARIFRENNQNVEPNTVDLHRLYVTEAEYYFKEAIQNTWDPSTGPLCVIVGKGIHSDDGVPKIKPAIQALGESLELTVLVDPENDGRLIVDLAR